MLILRWKPVFDASDPYNPSMHFEADLECPVCKKVFAVKTGEYCFRPALMSLEHRVNNGVKELAETRSCPECGVVSCLPDAKKVLLEKEIQVMITPEFIMEGLEKIKNLPKS